jgi:hypothetical protein
LLALAQPAGAKIVYTPTHHVIGPFGSYKLDLNHDGKTDFTIHEVRQSSTDGPTLNCLAAAVARGNAVEGYLSYRQVDVAVALKRGARISQSGGFVSKGSFGPVMACTVSSNGTQIFGPWVNATNRYLGLKFKIHGQTHYGWARLSVRRTGLLKIIATLTGYAYETVPNKPILAGKQNGSEESIELRNRSATTAPILQPASLGRLAQGETGLVTWRREKSVPTLEAAE